MKKILAILLAVMFVFTLASCGTKMTMGTGGDSGTYYAYGGILGRYMTEKAGVAVNVVTSGGSSANIQEIDAGNYQLGTVQSDVMSYAWNGERSFDGKAIKSFRTVAGLYDEALQLVTVNPDIKTVYDLEGKKVSIGDKGSGVYFNAVDVLAAADLTVDDIKPQYQSFAKSAESLKDGLIDAAFIVAGAPTTAITDLALVNKNVRIIPIDGEIAKKMKEANPFYADYEIKPKTYEGQKDTVNSVTVKATLIVSKDASEDDVYNMTKAIFENKEAIAKEHGKGKELDLNYATGSDLVVPFHKGAAKYFAEHGITVPVE